MNSTTVHDLIKPRIIRRDNGEWLAIAPKNARFSIGVTAPTENEAGEKFRSVYNEWILLLEAENT
jgi:hypothetical protein